MTDKADSDGCSNDISDKEYPYRDPETLKKLYHEKGLTQSQIADRLETVPSTISKWMAKYDIETRRRGPGRKAGATYRTNYAGRPYWNTFDPDGSSTGIFVHQLTAISAGYDPSDVFSDDVAVHHKNTVRWDNRESNVELVPNKKHNHTHMREEWVLDSETGEYVLKMADDDGTEGDE